MPVLQKAPFYPALTAPGVRRFFRTLQPKIRLAWQALFAYLLLSSTAGASDAIKKSPAAKYERDEFAVRIEPVATYAVGIQGYIRVVLEGRGGYKCNEKYPLSFKLTPSDDFKYPVQTVGKESAQIRGEKTVLKMALTPLFAGHKTVLGRFSFSVCNKKKCLMENRELALKLEVRETTE